MNKYTFLLFVIFVSQIAYCQQNIIRITSNDTIFLAGKYIQYFPDSTGELSIKDILSPDIQDRFLSNSNSTFSASPQKTAFWFKLTLSNTSGKDIWMEIGGIPAAEVDFYSADENQHYHTPLLTGSLRPEENRPIDLNMIWVPLNKASEHEPRTYYVRVVTYTIVQFPFYIGNTHQLYKKNAINDIVISGFIGFIIAMLLINLFIYFKTKQKSSLYYLGYLISVLILYPFIYNYELLKYVFFFIPFDWWTHHFAIIGVPPYIFIGLFGIEYLNLRKKLKIFSTIIKALIIIVSMIILLNLVVPSYTIMLPTLVVISLLGITCLLSSVILFTQKRNIKSLYYMIGWSFFILMNITFILSINGTIGYNAFTHNSILFGSVVEVTVFSLALAHKMGVIILVKEKVQEQNLELIKNHNSILEKKVVERTTVINTQKKKLEHQARTLEDLNHTKDKLFAIISHDLRNPISSLEAMIKLLSDNSISEEEFKNITYTLHKSVESISFTLNNLLHWANQQIKGINPDSQKFNLTNVFDENISLFKCMANKKGVTLLHDNHIDYWVKADKDQINLVVRNLISNALKFSKEGCTVEIKCSVKDEHFILVEIADNGIGMNTETKNKLFNNREHITNYGTSGEKGTGLGLLLCKEFVEGNGGSINVESAPGQGSRFYFTVEAFYSMSEPTIMHAL